jgi:bacteriorhodopsin
MGAIAISFLIFLVGTVIFIIKAYNSKEQSRYYFLAMYICAFSSMSYLAMLSGEGWIVVTGCRQFFYARYAESLITFPLVTVLLGAISGTSADSIASAIGASGTDISRFNSWSSILSSN